jgi:uncharacterized protein YkwD
MVILKMIRFKKIKFTNKKILIVPIGLVLVTFLGGLFIWDNALAKPQVKSAETKTSTEDKKDSPDNGVKTAEADKKATEQKPTTIPTATKAPAPTVSKAAPVTAKPKPKAAAPLNVSTPAGAQAYVEGVILNLVNGERARLGVRSLSNNGALAWAADVRVSEETISPDHTRANGSAFNTAFNQCGYTGYTAWGENLVWGWGANIALNQSSLNSLANKMFTLWKNSPEHYVNMKDPRFNQSGVGVIISGGKWYAIQEFARR